MTPYAIAADAGQWVEFREPSGGVPVRVAAFRDSEGNVLILVLTIRSY